MSAPDNTTSMSLQEAADVLGVHYMTAYRYVRLGLLPAQKQGASWTVSAADLDTFEPPRAGGRSSSDNETVVPIEIDEHADRAPLATALLSGDERAAWDIMHRVAQGASDIGTVHCELIAPVLERIGEGWENGEVTIADEHRATATLGRLIPQVGALFSRPGRRVGTVVLGGLQEDLHVLPSTLFADLLRSERVDVIDLGGAPPAQAFVDALERSEAPAVACISVMTSGLQSDIDVLVTAIRQGSPRSLIAVGGGAIRTEAEARAAGSDFWAPAPQDVARAIAAAARELAGTRATA